MKKKKHTDVLKMITLFQQNILANKPSHAQMYDELRMMRFQIKPVSGSVTKLDFKNETFIEMLWGLGKIDEFFQKHIKTLTPQEKRVFQSVFTRLQQSFHNQFNKIAMATAEEPDAAGGFEIEIFKARGGIAN